MIIAKLNSYGFDLRALNLIHNYLTKRKQGTKINQSYGSLEVILFGIPRGSILGPILFDIFLSDLFLIVDDIDIANYADDNTIYKEHENIDDLITSLQDAAAKLFKWFSDNQMKGNTDKCYLLLSKDESSEIHTGDSIIESSTCKKLFGIKTDSKLCFDDHIQALCNKVNRKLRALARAKCWEIFPAKIKEINSVNSFKIEIRKWVPQSCPCRLCKQDISGVFFFWFFLVTLFRVGFF